MNSRPRSTPVTVKNPTKAVILNREGKKKTLHNVTPPFNQVQYGHSKFISLQSVKACDSNREIARHKHTDKMTNAQN